MNWQDVITAEEALPRLLRVFQLAHVSEESLKRDLANPAAMASARSYQKSLWEPDRAPTTFCLEQAYRHGHLRHPLFFWPQLTRWLCRRHGSTCFYCLEVYRGGWLSPSHEDHSCPSCRRIGDFSIYRADAEAEYVARLIASPTFKKRLRKNAAAADDLRFSPTGNPSEYESMGVIVE
jgi:hypothetical protein